MQCKKYENKKMVQTDQANEFDKDQYNPIASATNCINKLNKQSYYEYSILDRRCNVNVNWEGGVSNLLSIA